MNFFAFPHEIRKINKRGVKISCGGVSKNHEKNIRLAPPPLPLLVYLNLRVMESTWFLKQKDKHRVPHKVLESDFHPMRKM